MFKPSNNPKVLELTKSITERSCGLDQIKPLILEELNIKGRNKKLCAWCFKEEIFHHNCKYNYKPEIELMMEKEYSKYPNTPRIPLDKLDWWYLKRLKSRVPKDRKPEVDHILAISKGGQSLGLDNHQVLCYLCHKTKTKSDLSGRRSK